MPAAQPEENKSSGRNYRTEVAYLAALEEATQCDPLVGFRVPRRIENVQHTDGRTNETVEKNESLKYSTGYNPQIWKSFVRVLLAT